jgi:polar amino acid transport system substrate-binding protein
MARLLLLLLAALLGPPAAQAVSLRLCTADQPFYPFTMPDGSGRHQFLLRQAVRGLPIELENYMAPRPRCLLDVRSGQADAALGVFNAERQRYLAFPMKGDQVDPRQGLGEVRLIAYRRKGSPVSWDGQRFAHLDGGAIGVLFGFAYGPKLDGLGVPIDDRAITHDQLLQKLARGRNPVIILQEQPIGSYLTPALAARVEALSPAFDQFTLYLMVSRDYQARNRELVQRLWRALEAGRASREYQQYQPP